jgi:hypothetical protein
LVVLTLVLKALLVVLVEGESEGWMGELESAGRGCVAKDVVGVDRDWEYEY